jgi:murein L,D-transpeptidase YafK
MSRLLIVSLASLWALCSHAADLLPAYLIKLPPSVSTALIAESTTATLHQFGNGAGGISSRERRYMSVGKNGVGKQQAWDGRTPLGIYFVSEQLDTSKLDDKYGPTAFPLDYPSVWDRLQGRTGDGIWIHGVGGNGGRRPPLDTDGCIALSNDELLALEPALTPTVTPIVITRHIVWAERAELAELREELEAAVDLWRQSLASGDLHRLLAMYDAGFSFRGMNKEEWMAYRAQSVSARPVENITVDDLLLLADPEEPELYMSRFRQHIIEPGREISVTKRLYWRRSRTGELRIVAEDNG